MHNILLLILSQYLIISKYNLVLSQFTEDKDMINYDWFITKYYKIHYRSKMCLNNNMY